MALSMPHHADVRVPIGVKVGLWLLSLVCLLAGLQQQFAPRAFYNGFPGFGRQWVSVDGPYNEHLPRDLGGANLALALVILVAVFRPSANLFRAIAVASLVAQTSRGAPFLAANDARPGCTHGQARPAPARFAARPLRRAWHAGPRHSIYCPGARSTTRSRAFRSPYCSIALTSTPLPAPGPCTHAGVHGPSCMSEFGHTIPG